MRKHSIVFALLLLTVAAAACVKRVEESPIATGIGPNLALEQFLTAANAQDLPKMASLFGTSKNGSVTTQWPKDEVEKRMFIFANVLRHEDYAIEGEGLVPGRLNEAKVLNVALTQKEKKIVVPFTLVRFNDTWLVEHFDMEKILGAR